MIKSRLEHFAKYAGIVTVLFEWLALLIYYLQMPAYFGGQYPISYFATFPQTQLAFIICYTLAAISFWIFAQYHLGKHFQAPVKIFGLSMLAFAGMAVFPYDPNNTMSSIIHSLLAYSMGVTFLIGMYLLVRKSADKYLYRGTVLAIVLNTLLTLAFIAVPKDSLLVFTFEAGSWLVIQLWIVWISYYIYKKRKTT